VKPSPTQDYVNFQQALALTSQRHILNYPDYTPNSKINQSHQRLPRIANWVVAPGQERVKPSRFDPQMLFLDYTELNRTHAPSLIMRCTKQPSSSCLEHGISVKTLRALEGRTNEQDQHAEPAEHRQLTLSFTHLPMLDMLTILHSGEITESSQQLSG
jgi:hypothetical protein